MMRLRIGLLLAVSLIAVEARAQTPAVEALLKQGSYWQSKGRKDLAAQAYRRVLAIDPANATARRALAQASPAPPPAAARAVTPSKVPNRAPGASLPAVAAPAAPRTAAVSTTAVPAADRAGDSRAAGFRKLDANDLTGAARDFRAALAIRPNDAESLGGLGLVQLRQQRFVEARDNLARASSQGRPAQWAEALASARFFAGLESARSLRAAGRIDEAQKIAEELSASSSPDRGPALELLAQIYEAKGHFAEAAALYQTAAGLRPSQSAPTAAAPAATGARLQLQATRALALEAAAANNDSEAERLFRRGLMEGPADPWIRYDYGRFLTQRGRRNDVQGLISSLTMMPGVEPIYAAALLNSQIGQDGVAEQLMGRIPEDQQTVPMRSFIAGLRVDAAVARARSLAGRGQPAEGLALLRQQAQTPGLSMGKLGQLASALQDLGDKPGATTLALQGLRLGSTDPADFESVVRVLAQTGQDDLAQQAVQQAATAAGAFGGGQALLARLNAVVVVTQADRMREAEDYAPAFDLLQSAWLASPGNIEILGALARLYQSGGLAPQAAQTFRMVLEKSPDDKGALIGLVDTAASSGDHALARAALERALRLAPEDYTVYLAAARMERARGNQGASARYLRQARALYTRQAQATGGGFGTSNPFAATARRDTIAAAPVNPFELATRSTSTRRSADDDLLPGRQPSRRSSNDNLLAGFDDRATLGTLPGTPPPFANRVGRPLASSDPILQSIDQDLGSFAAADETRADVKTEYRQRVGEVGLSQLKSISGRAEVSTGFAGGRVSAVALASTIDAGRPIGSGLARFGRNATPEAEAIVAAQPSRLTAAGTQVATGVAVSVGWANDLVKADVGSTPLGFGETSIVGGISVSPRLSPSVTARIWGERRAVEDSVISHAGTTDPVTGDFWGAVRRAGGGASVSYDVEGTGVYADGSYYRYAGRSVRSNSGIQANVGGYLRIASGETSLLSVGTNANYQRFDNQQNYFTFGHGGYFSPQSFLSVSFPIHYQLRRPQGLDIDVNVAPGYQSYSQDAADVYPTDPAAQARLNALKVLNNDVRSTFDSSSETGFGLSANASVYYAINPRMKIGSEANYNSFGAYREFRGSVGIKQVIGD
ncbi:cellulose synthase subunit BcsC-related outer membrane protein [Polymorphobacter sp.]|uniref:cellulose biosynthesis protein BcsC n=1 Tax=Polymorphobacter sp. TaxID=1909290 RepID=UPI003F6EAA9D